eukprot:1160748-Pelagomonas_calceolata.AAC.1
MHKVYLTACRLTLAVVQANAEGVPNSMPTHTCSGASKSMLCSDTRTIQPQKLVWQRVCRPLGIITPAQKSTSNLPTMLPEATHQQIKQAAQLPTVFSLGFSTSINKTTTHTRTHTHTYTIMPKTLQHQISLTANPHPHHRA